MPLRKAAAPVVARPRPAAIARQRQRDEAAVLVESISDEFDVESLLETDDALSFRRRGIGPEVVRKLRRGVWAIQAQLDLHGLRRDEARERLAEFLRDSARAGLRCVRVIHGKGNGSPGREPVLKAKVRGWLVQRSEVLAFTHARAADGGHGALIVLLRPADPVGGRNARPRRTASSARSAWRVGADARCGAALATPTSGGPPARGQTGRAAVLGDADDRARRRRAGHRLEQQAALLHRFAHRGIDRDLAEQVELQRFRERLDLRHDEAVDHELQLVADRAPFAGLADLVDDQADRAPLLLRGQHLDRRVGVGHRGRLGRGEHEHVVGERDRVQHDVGDAGAGVEQDAVEARRHRLDDALELRRAPRASGASTRPGPSRRAAPRSRRARAGSRRRASPCR